MAEANTPRQITAADLSLPTSYSPNGLPTYADDLVVVGMPSPTEFNLRGNAVLTAGSFNNSSSAAITLANTTPGGASTLILGGPGSGDNTTVGASFDDLIHAAMPITIGQGRTNSGVGLIDVVLGRSGTFRNDNVPAGGAGLTLTINAPIFNNGHQLSFAGSGATAVNAVLLNDDFSPVSYPSYGGIAGYGGISGSGGVNIATTGGGSVTLYGENAYTGDTTIRPGATLNLSGTIDNSRSVVNDGQLILGRTGKYTFNNIITGTGKLTVQTGAGLSSVTVNDFNTYTGPTRLNFGTLIAKHLANGGQASSIGASTNAASNLLLGRPLLYIGAGDSTDRLFTSLYGAASIAAGATNTLTLIESSGTGPLAFTNTGAIAYDVPNVIRTVSLGGTNAANNQFAPSISDNGTATVSFLKTGTGTWRLTGNNTYSGQTYIASGTLIAGTPQSLGSGTSKNVVLDAGTLALDFPLTSAFIANRISSTSTGTIALSTNSSAALDFTTAGTTQLGALAGTTCTYTGDATFTNNAYRFGGGGGTLNVASAITGANATVTIGTRGTVVLSGTNTYTGLNTINGTLRLANAGAAGTGSIKLASGGTLVPFGPVDQTLVNRLSSSSGGTIAFPGTNNQTLTLSASHDFSLSADGIATFNGTINPYGDYKLGGTGGTLTFNSTLTGDAGLSVSGVGPQSTTVIVNGPTTYAGSTSVTRATLGLGPISTISNSLLTLFDAAVDLGGHDVAVTRISPSNSRLSNGSLAVSSSFDAASFNTSLGSIDLSELNRLSVGSVGSPASGFGFRSNDDFVVSTVGTNSGVLAELKLPDDTSITATSCVIGSSGDSVVTLGKNTSLSVGTITFGGRYSKTSLRYAGELDNGTLKIRSTDGVSPATMISINSNKSSTTDFDLSRLIIDAMANDVYVGYHNVVSDSVTTLTMGGQASVLNAGRLWLGYAYTAGTSGISVDTFKQTGGTTLAGAVYFNSKSASNFIGDTLLSNYELGSAGTPALLSTHQISLGGAEQSAKITSKSRATIQFINGRIETFDETRAANLPAQPIAVSEPVTIIRGMIGGGAANDYRTLTINLAGSGTHTFAAGQGKTLQVESTVLITGQGGLNVEGPGTVSFAGANAYAGLTTVNSGTLSLAAAAQNAVLSGGGADLRGGRLVLEPAADPAQQQAQVRSLLTASFASNFNAGQLNSTTAMADRGLGYTIDASSFITIAPAIYGDADLNGRVDFNDFLALQNGFGTDAGWQGGDFNYDNVVNFNDFLVLQNHFGQSMTGAPVAVTAAQVAAMTAFAQSVPEPAMTGILLAALPLMKRRRVA